MLTSLRIQNFRSIRDASVKLGQVNLFIGPNNSGKSNFLKGVNLFSSIIESYPESIKLSYAHFSTMVTRPKEGVHLPRSINFSFRLLTDDANEHFFAFSNSKPELLEENFISVANQLHVPSQVRDEQMAPISQSFHKELNALRLSVKDAIIYRLDPLRFKLSSAITPTSRLLQDGSNIISFLFNLNQNYRKNYQQLEKDFARCLGDLVLISTPVIPTDASKADKSVQKENKPITVLFKLKFFDQNDVGYWAEEVSEGVLYFLALLCIIHQPDPPKLLLLEEPEKGIHPRRIKEVMDFIFELAQLRGIQIILTSHSPYVVDHFADIPECISVFDRENGETVIRNAGDIITDTNDKLEAEGKKPIRYSDSLGEHWVSGFLGGVPLDTSAGQPA